MLGVNGGAEVGAVQAYATSGRGLNVEELADMAMRKLINVADTTPPAIRDQVNQFKQQMRLVLMAYMHQAIKSDRTTLYNELLGLGFKEAAEYIRLTQGN